MKKAIRNAAGLLLLGGLWVAQAAQAGSISVITNTTDAGAPSDFGFTLFTPIPVLTGLVSWSADVSGTLIDGGRDGVSLAPFGPSIYEFIINGVSVGTDALGTVTSDYSGSYSGLYDCGVGCFNMQMNINFTGSGGDDTYIVEGLFRVEEAVVSAPEPGITLLFSTALAGLFYARRRKRA